MFAMFCKWTYEVSNNGNLDVYKSNSRNWKCGQSDSELWIRQIDYSQNQRMWCFQSPQKNGYCEYQHFKLAMCATEDIATLRLRRLGTVFAETSHAQPKSKKHIDLGGARQQTMFAPLILLHVRIRSAKPLYNVFTKRLTMAKTSDLKTSKLWGFFFSQALQAHYGLL